MRQERMQWDTKGKQKPYKTSKTWSIHWLPDFLAEDAKNEIYLEMKKKSVITKTWEVYVPLEESWFTEEN